MCREVVKQGRERLPQGGHVAQHAIGRLLQTHSDRWFCQLEDQVVGSQAGNIDAGVKSLQRVIEVVGQEDCLELALSEYLLGPVGGCHFSAAAS